MSSTKVYMCVFKYADYRRNIVKRIHEGLFCFLFFFKAEKLVLSHGAFLIFFCSPEQYFDGSAARLHKVILVRNKILFRDTRGNM